MINSWLTVALGAVIFEARKDRRLSAPDFAGRAGVTVPDLLAIERGKRDVDLITLNEICAMLSLPINAIMGLAHNRDSERIAVSSNVLINLDGLRKSHRDVITIPWEQLPAGLLNLRIDLLIAGDHDVEALQRDTGPNTLKQMRVIVSEEHSHAIDLELLSGDADEALMQLTKGKICELRRFQDGLRDQYDDLQKRRDRLVVEQEAMHKHMESMLLWQHDSLMAGTAIGAALAGRIANMVDGLQQDGRDLQRMDDMLASEQRDVDTESRFARHRQRFLLKQEMDEQSGRAQRGH